MQPFVDGEDGGDGALLLHDSPRDTVIAEFVCAIMAWKQLKKKLTEPAAGGMYFS